MYAHTPLYMMEWTLTTILLSLVVMVVSYHVVKFLFRIFGWLDRMSPFIAVNLLSVPLFCFFLAMGMITAAKQKAKLETFEGSFAGVSEGPTLSVRMGNGDTRRIRLYGIAEFPVAPAQTRQYVEEKIAMGAPLTVRCLPRNTGGDTDVQSGYVFGSFGGSAVQDELGARLAREGYAKLDGSPQQVLRYIGANRIMGAARAEKKRLGLWARRAGDAETAVR